MVKVKHISLGKTIGAARVLVTKRLYRYYTRLNNVPPKIHVHPEPQHVILYEIKVFADVIRVRIEMKSHLIRRGPKSHGNFKREKRRNAGRQGCEGGSRDWSDASTSQGMLRITGNHQKLSG